jgi:sterol desaturase/sphingolipid hydroxylase (fatty acid hydroxylase superfamily)
LALLMNAIQLAALGEDVAKPIEGWADQLGFIFLSPRSTYSLGVLAMVFCLAVVATVSGRRPGRQISLRLLFRALFPRRLVKSPSGRADLGWFVFSGVIAGGLFGWAIYSSVQIEQLAGAYLDKHYAAPMWRVPQALTIAVMTIAVYLAYEFAYWLDHYLKHKVPALWAFHKVHHSAESLSPLTNFRVHPFDTIVFYNIVALVVGLTEGTARFLLGPASHQFSIWGVNALLLAGAVCLTHLQHSHLWISFTGRLGRTFLSPAHHQIHHSRNPLHFDRNLGNTLAAFDLMFGTLHVPAKKREDLRFGVDDLGYNPHGFAGGLLLPAADGWRALNTSIASFGRRLRRLRPTPVVSPAAVAAQSEGALFD